MIDARAKLMKDFIKYEGALLRLQDKSRRTFTFVINDDNSMREFLVDFFTQKKDAAFAELKKHMKVK
jgi:hypothetical protein